MEEILNPEGFANLDGPVTFIGFHPDDLEFHASGLAARLTSAGAAVSYVIVTSGECGGSPRIREEEQRKAALSVGVKQIEFLRLNDGSLGREYHSGRLEKRLADLIRLLKPSTIVTFSPTNLTTRTFGAEHPDHRYGALATWDAVYPAARQPGKRSRIRFWRDPLPGHRVSQVLWFGDPLTAPHAANCFIPVDSVWSSMKQSMQAHSSQWDEAVITAQAFTRAKEAANRWKHDGLVEEYHRVVLCEDRFAGKRNPVKAISGSENCR